MVTIVSKMATVVKKKKSIKVTIEIAVDMNDFLPVSKQAIFSE